MLRRMIARPLARRRVAHEATLESPATLTKGPVLRQGLLCAGKSLGKDEQPRLFSSFH